MISDNNLNTITIACPDQSGIVASVTGFLRDQGANILELDQHATTAPASYFFMRVVFEGIEDEGHREALKGAFAATVALQFDMDWHLTHRDKKKRLAILCSHEEHA